MKSTPLAIALLMFLSSSALAESVLRIHCGDDAEGARVFIDGEPKGSCPADLFLPPGDTSLRVVKPVDDERERVYETELSLVDESARRVIVKLSHPRLTAEARQQRERARLAREKKAAKLAMEKAEDGDTDAMRELAGYYRNGKGVSEDTDKAEQWATRAETLDSKRLARKTLEQAEAGSVNAMQRMADLYESGDGVPQDDAKASEWRRRADLTLAENTLEKAENGNVSSMKAMATLYEEGKGVEKNTEKAQEWANRAETATAEREQRKTERARRFAAKKHNAKLQRKIDNSTYFFMTGDALDYSSQDPVKGPAMFLLMSPFMTAIGGIEGTSALTQSTKVAYWKSQMVSRPATFENPDSMIARAYSGSPAVTE